MDFGQPTDIETAFLAQNRLAAADIAPAQTIVSEVAPVVETPEYVEAVTPALQADSFQVSRERAKAYLIRAQQRHASVALDEHATLADKIRAQNILLQAEQDLESAYDGDQAQPAVEIQQEGIAKRGKNIFGRLIAQFRG